MLHFKKVVDPRPSQKKYTNAKTDSKSYQKITRNYSNPPHVYNTPSTAFNPPAPHELEVMVKIFVVSYS